LLACTGIVCGVLFLFFFSEGSTFAPMMCPHLCFFLYFFPPPVRCLFFGFSFFDFYCFYSFRRHILQWCSALRASVILVCLVVFYTLASLLLLRSCCSEMSLGTPYSSLLLDLVRCLFRFLFFRLFLGFFRGTHQAVVWGSGDCRL